MLNLNVYLSNLGGFVANRPIGASCASARLEHSVVYQVHCRQLYQTRNPEKILASIIKLKSQ